MSRDSTTVASRWPKVVAGDGSGRSSAGTYTAWNEVIEPFLVDVITASSLTGTESVRKHCNHVTQLACFALKRGLPLDMAAVLTTYGATTTGLVLSDNLIENWTWGTYFNPTTTFTVTAGPASSDFSAKLWKPAPTRSSRSGPYAWSLRRRAKYKISTKVGR